MTVVPSARASDATEIHVVDEGPGLTAEQRERAFDRFWRAGSGAGGSGLGLAIVRRLVEADGGEVEPWPTRRAAASTPSSDSAAPDRLYRILAVPSPPAFAGVCLSVERSSQRMQGATMNKRRHALSLAAVLAATVLTGGAAILGMTHTTAVAQPAPGRGRAGAAAPAAQTWEGGD